MIDYERGHGDGQRDSRAGTTYVCGSSEYERGYRDGYSDKCNSVRGLSLLGSQMNHSATPLSLVQGIFGRST